MDEPVARVPTPEADHLDSDFGLLVVGGKVRVDSRENEDAPRRIGDTIGRLLQVRNLAVLIGAGASFHLGSPNIRALRAEGVHSLAAEAERPLLESETNLLNALVGDTTVDLEHLLEILSASIAYASAVSASHVTLRRGQSAIPTAVFTSLRGALNTCLVHACDLPKKIENTAVASAPFKAHQEFFRRMLRSRRGDLPRVKVFTTNYDLVIERSLDQIGITYIDGFAGTLDRSFAPRVYNQEVFLPGATDDRRMLRLEDVLYLYKIHGSINWRAGQSVDGESGTVVQVPKGERRSTDELALIYPTPHKELDILGFPYAELFRALSEAVTEPETALLVVGYSFADEHINRILFQALSSNPTLQLFVVNPFGILDLDAMASSRPTPDSTPDTEVAEDSNGSVTTARNRRLPEVAAPSIAFLNTRIAGLAQAQDARVYVYTGAGATFETLATQVMPDPDALSGEKDARAGEAALRSALVDPSPRPLA